MSRLMTALGDSDGYWEIAGREADTDATRDLQKHLGLEPCFRTLKLLSCTTDCLWRYHCRKPVAEWQRDW